MTTKQSVTKLELFSLTAAVNGKDHLVIGGCDSVQLAEEFGTPLYVFDEDDLRHQCTAFKQEFHRHYPETTVCYSAKAFTARAMLQLVRDEGLDLDVVSGGELELARIASFPMDRIHFPCNNKSAEEIEAAIEHGIAHIVVDNLH
jgi:diaminopimelate decarboxylase